MKYKNMKNNLESLLIQKEAKEISKKQLEM